MNWKHKVIVFTAILCASFAIHRSHLFSFPNAIHSWSQTDHLALSHGFLKNGFNFFLPQTYMLNKVYDTYANTVTAVDFPINNYVVAGIMKATGDTSAAPFRFYMLIYSCIGLMFFFLFVYRKSKSRLLSATLVLFVLGSAVFLDYQDGLIPSITALSNVFIALYFLDLYWSDYKKKWFVLALLFLSLAAMVRTPYALFTIALLIEWLSRFIRRARQIETFELLTILCALVIPTLYFVYNGYLRSTYGTLFLSQALTPKSLDDFSKILDVINEKWLFHYWSIANYVALILAFLLIVFIFVKQPVRLITQILNSRLAIWSIIAVGGGSAYMLLMFYQFSQHDYYILDSLFVVIVLAFSIGLVALYRLYNYKRVLLFSLLALSVYGFRDSVQLLKQRRKHDVTSIESRAYESYFHANALLDRFGVKPNERILVPDTYAPNVPLIVMRRDGYSVPYPTDATVDSIRQWDWKYVLFQDYLIEKLFLQPYPQFFEGLKRMGGNGEISIFERKKGTINPDLLSLMNISAKHPFFVDTTYYSEWERYISLPDRPRTGRTTSETEYDLSKDFILYHSPSQSGIHMVAEMDYSLISDDKEILLTVVVEQKDGKLLDWQAVQLKDVPADEQGNRKLKKFFAIHNLNGDRKLIVSIWNPGKNEMRYENLKISLYDGAD